MWAAVLEIAGYDSTRMNAQTPVDWTRVDTVLLDMDGTVLDLNFDNRFWLHYLPRHYAEARQMDVRSAWAELEPRFNFWRGRLEWYCVDHWTRELGLDVAELKSLYTSLIRLLPGAAEFLAAVRAAGKRLWLVTNAHPASVELKMARTQLSPSFDLILSSHHFGFPKEDSRFWPKLSEKHPFDPARALMVDDSLPVLSAALEFGVAQVRAITSPDSQQPPRVITELPAIAGLIDIKPS
jgi:putative hydrolase of the HAD superfamily